jgi:glycosyltransferase involved in cell wall biosynthesis
MNERRISVVIPAYNEAANIGRTIASVFAHVPSDRLAEVIVCDHGSADETVQIAMDAGAQVETWLDGTIAKQRNRGAALTTGDVLVFLDADTTLTPEWADALPSMLERLDTDGKIVTGSHVQPPEDGNSLERYWFTPIARHADPTHLGSAHLILTREHFDRIGGFDESLETGEDFEICVRATANGSTVVNDQGLRAVHHDFPKTIDAFIRREAWHGRGNFASLAMFRSSPVGPATVVFVGLHAAIPLVPTMKWLPALGIAGLCAASSWKKFKNEPLGVKFHNTGVFYLYYCGRSLALLRRVSGKS